MLEASQASSARPSDKSDIKIKIGMEQLCNDTDRGKTKQSTKTTANVRTSFVRKVLRLI
jgi:hypothetical protein